MTAVGAGDLILSWPGRRQRRRRWEFAGSESECTSRIVLQRRVLAVRWFVDGSRNVKVYRGVCAAWSLAQRKKDVVARGSCTVVATGRQTIPALIKVH